MKATPTTSPSDPTHLESVVALDQELDRRVEQTRRQAEQRVQQARQQAEHRVAQETERIAQRCADRLQRGKREWREEMARESDRQLQDDLRILDGLGDVRSQLRDAVLRKVTGP